MPVSQVKPSIESGWSDEVGSSITRYVNEAAIKLNRAIEAYNVISVEATKLISQNIEYKSFNQEIGSLRVD